MSSSVGFLDFFILEAGEYVEQLDGLLARADAAGPDGDAMQRAARSLRGSATMAKLPAFAELAHALERVGRARRDGSLAWDDRVRGAVVSAVDELKILLRAARSWSDAETARATARANELTSLVPGAWQRPTPVTPGASSGMQYLAGEASNVAAGLELLLTRPEDAAGAAMVLRRVRALRGVAAIKDLPAIVGQVLEAAEQAAQPLEQGRRDLAPAQRELMTTSVEVLRGAADALRRGTRAEPDAATARRFGDALDAWLDAGGEGDRIVPIASLFHDDAGPHVVHAEEAPPTTASQRFRLELVSQGEHLRRLADEASGAHDDAARERYRRELRRSLRAVRALAQSFEERETEALATEVMDAGAFDAPLLERVRRMAALLADPALDRDGLHERLAALGGPQEAETPESPETKETPTAPRAAVPAYAEVLTEPMPMSAPDLLEQGLAGLAKLETEPLGEPSPLAEETLVPVDALVYRGRAALRRAIEIRDEARRHGGPASSEVIEELFDLLDLALLDEAHA